MVAKVCELEATLVRLHTGCQYNNTLCDYMEHTTQSKSTNLKELELILKNWGMLDGQVSG